MTPYEVNKIIKSDEYDSHQLFVKPVFKHQPWMIIKDHPVFSGFLSNHINKQKQTHMNVGHEISKDLPTIL